MRRNLPEAVRALEPVTKLVWLYISEFPGEYSVRSLSDLLGVHAGRALPALVAAGLLLQEEPPTARKGGRYRAALPAPENEGESTVTDPDRTAARIAELLGESGIPPEEARRLAGQAALASRRVLVGQRYGRVFPADLPGLWLAASRAGRRRLVLEIENAAEERAEDVGRVNVRVLEAQNWPGWTGQPTEGGLEDHLEDDCGWALLPEIEAPEIAERLAARIVDASVALYTETERDPDERRAAHAAAVRALLDREVQEARVRARGKAEAEAARQGAVQAPRHRDPRELN